MFYAKAARDCALRMLGDGRYIVVYRMTAFCLGISTYSSIRFRIFVLFTSGIVTFIWHGLWRQCHFFC